MDWNLAVLSCHTVNRIGSSWDDRDAYEQVYILDFGWHLYLGSILDRSWLFFRGKLE